ncbi:von Willebrand factor A domain-containing protein 2 [Pteropus alecto]|uniref:von Willebrand factor A domain-containing protein 2 n=1 Tax=Pteropus alecto TaxID=9402 RepID=L5JZU0_PTEAL|nr:von Willebrand factor A domain-containing protein 2 [Pteropus alecto]
MPSVLLLEAVCIFLVAGVTPSLPLQEVHVSKETIGKISAASKMMWCSAAMDVLFLIDGSHSIGKGSFERAKHFAITVCDALDVNPERDGDVVAVVSDEPPMMVAVVSFCATPGWVSEHFAEAFLCRLRRRQEVRVGAFQFSSVPRLEFPLDSLSTQQEVKAKLKRMVFKYVCSNTATVRMQLAALKIVVGCPEKAVGIQKPSHAQQLSVTWEKGLVTIGTGVQSRRGFPGGRNVSVPHVLIIITDGRSQGHVALPAKQLQERGVTVFAVGVRFPRWEELHTLASEPREQHVLMAEQVEDATNGFFSTLSSSAICASASPDGDLQAPGGVTAVAVILAAPTLSLECRADVLFLLASSAGMTPEGFLRAKAFVRSFVQASLDEDSWARVGVAWYSRELELAVPVGEYQDVPDLVRSLEAIPFSGGATLTGSALRQVAERGFGSAAWTGQDRPRRVVVLLTESRTQDEVAGPAHHARARGLLLLGVGSEAVRAELEEITGSPEHVMVYADPQDLVSQVPELQGKLCSRPRPGCQAPSLDLVFVLDASASVGPENFVQMQGFVRSCTLQFDVNPDVTQIGLVVYGSQVQTAFRLDTHVTRAAVLRAMSQAPYLGGVGSAGTALLHIYDKVMTVQRGARPGVPKAVVVLTGGRGAEDAVVPIQKLRDDGISVLIVGVGPVLGEALRRLAGPRDTLIHVAAYADLRFHRDALMEWLCGEAKRPVNLCKPSPCMNEGSCVLRNGSYRCACQQGWEGPHCETRKWGWLCV